MPEVEGIMAIHLFADNESALDSLFNVGRHSGQALSVLAAAKLHHWLEANPH